MLLCDDAHTIVDANRVACLLLRLTRGQAVGLAVEDLAAADQGPRLQEALGPIDDDPEAVQDRSPVTIALSVPDGQRLVVDLVCLPRVSEGLHLLTLDFPASGVAAVAPRLLTEREREVLTQVALGRTGQEIAADLFVAPATVESHVSHALGKLQATNRAHGVALALRAGELDEIASSAAPRREESDSERALLSARDRLRVLTTTMAEGLIMLDPFRSVDDLNPAAVRMLGRDPDELRGRSVHDAVYAPNVPGGALTVPSDVPVRTEHDEFVRGDGTTFEVAYTVVPFDDGEGSGWMILFRDVDEHPRDAVLPETERMVARMVRAIREALDEGRFALHALPVVDLGTGRRIRYELLPSVTSRDGALITPGRLLPVAREHGLLQRIDSWGLDQALRLSGHGHAVEFDVSVESVTDPTCATRLTELMTSGSVRPELLTLGVPQAALSADATQTGAFVRRVAHLGGAVALTDFGFGYAGVAHLRDLPWTDVKIDVGLLSELRERESSRGVVRAFVELAHGFGLRGIVRGVEEEATRATLLELGVDAAQGDRLWPTVTASKAFPGEC